MIRTIIIDDETTARNTLKSLLRAINAPLEIIDEADDIKTGIKAIETHQPDLVFLDIQLKTGTGFDVLKALSDFQGEIIFVTAYDNFAIKAFQMAAFGYLLKPLQINELKEVVGRFEEQYKAQKVTASRTRILIENFDEGSIKKLVIQNVSGFRVLSINEILYLRGEVNYTRFILKTGEKLMTSKTLKEYENILTNYGYYRIHQSYLINLRHVKEYIKGEGGEVVMSNGDRLDVSRRRKSQFVARFLGR
ncbi:MAG: LytTR family DNA-binding domain-containing protein [Bacteroidota bacterium]